MTGTAAILLPSASTIPRCARVMARGTPVRRLLLRTRPHGNIQHARAVRPDPCSTRPSVRRRRTRSAASTRGWYTASALSASARPWLSVHSEAALLGAVAGALSPSEILRHVPQIAASRRAALEGWIDGHLHEPITLGRLCAIAGVASRTLQRAFEQRRGMSPMRFVAERRLAAAHRALRSGPCTRSVTQIATAMGFSHPGPLRVHVLSSLWSDTGPDTGWCAEAIRIAPRGKRMESSFDAFAHNLTFTDTAFTCFSAAPLPCRPRWTVA
jgi:AraC-like DNA-binding protein